MKETPLTDELEYTDCLFCKSKAYEKAFIGKDYLFSLKEFPVVRCSKCDLLYTNPRIKENIISYYYPPEYVPYREIKKSVSFLRNIWDKVGCFLGNPAFRILKLLKSRRVKTVLEIGPGAGYLLSLLKKHGFNVTGVEINKNCVERLMKKGITCYLGDLNEAINEIGSKRFDAIILYQVFEHLYHPNKTLKHINNLLNENGIIYLSLPNSDSWEAKLFGKYWIGFDLPRHVAHYNPYVIRKILIQAGFVTIKLADEVFPSSLLESIGSRFFKRYKMPKTLYYFLYYPWRLLQPFLIKFIGSGVMVIIANKTKRL